jgi:alkaline phosphatase D
VLQDDADQQGTEPHMTEISRREVLAMAAALGASAAWGRLRGLPSFIAWTERRDLYPEGVASGDPRPDGVVLWTRRPGNSGPVALTLEVAEDPAFARVVATAHATARAEYDWTVRVLVGGLAPAREYWYRFTDGDGAGSRVGRTITAPSEDDHHPVRFAFVSCQDPTTGYLHAYRRMIHEDERATPADRLAFVLHLGDFIYEVVTYPEYASTYYDRKVRELFRYPRGQKVVRDFHVPVDVEDYRTAYRAYLHDPDLQDARARWPFVSMWDNHEFSWNGWQSLQNFGAGNIPAQSRKVAANQAWWEYQPARVATPGGSLEAFHAPRVADVPIEHFDEHGLGEEANNLAAIGSLTAYRALRFGRHLELIITDQHSYRSEEPTGRPEARALASPDFPELMPEDAMAILDAGHAWNGGNPPATIRFGEKEFPNFRRESPPQTTLGAEQKAWFLERLRASRATWKVWGNSQGVLDWRADPQNLPAQLTKPWPGAGYAGFGGGDLSTAYVERAEIYDFVARERITGFACVAGDRHSFWAGLMAKALPPAQFEPVGVAFITGSISAAGLVEALEHVFPKNHPLRSLFLVDRPDAPHPDATVNMLLRHGVRSCLEYAASRELTRARARSNPDNSPHLAFVDMGGHGYATVRVSADALESEFVCIPRPVAPTAAVDGGPLHYRLVHRVPLWRAGQRPRLEQRVIEGEPGLGG